MDSLIIGILLTIFGYLGIRYINNKKDSKKELEYKLTDADLKSKQVRAIKDLEKLEETIRKTKEDVKNMSPEEIEKYWNENN